jgi:hypothetical protein
MKKVNGPAQAKLGLGNRPRPLKWPKDHKRWAQNPTLQETKGGAPGYPKAIYETSASRLEGHTKCPWAHQLNLGATSYMGVESN